MATTSTTANVHTPLLPLPATAAAVVAVPVNAGAPAPLNRLQRIAIKVFAVLRALRGLSLIAYPTFGLYALDIPANGSTYMLASLLGVRDMLFAVLLHTADLDCRRETRRALVVNLLSDAMDAFVLIFYAAWDDDWGNPLAAIVVTAVMALMEHLTLWSLDDDDEDDASARKPRFMQYEEDKNTRMTAWLRELRRCEESRPTSPLGARGD